MKNFGYVKKISDEQFIVNANIDEYGSGYGVVSREKDPECAYDINDVSQYVAEHPEMLFKHYNNEPDKRKDEVLNEIAQIEEWFVEVYDNQVKQYNRCVRTGHSFDNKYGTIEDLDNLAAENAARLCELRTLLSEDDNSLKFKKL